MKILLISASPRKMKSRTLALARDVLKGLGDGALIDVVHLRDLKIEFCRHCESCHKTCMRCPIRDDAHELLDKMLSADGIILASPNYINQVTASLKAILERSSHFIHCQRLLGKYVCGVVTSGSGTQDDIVQDYMRYYAQVCGAQYSGGVSACANALEAKADEAFRLGEKFMQDWRGKKQYPDQLEKIAQGKEHFRRIIQMRQDAWKGEYEYWQKQGWL